MVILVGYKHFNSWLFSSFSARIVYSGILLVLLHCLEVSMLGLGEEEEEELKLHFTIAILILYFLWCKSGEAIPNQNILIKLSLVTFWLIFTLRAGAFQTKCSKKIFLYRGEVKNRRKSGKILCNFKHSYLGCFVNFLRSVKA